MSRLKTVGCDLLAGFGVARAFRRLNRRKCLVLMYHGVTEEAFDPPVWTQLPRARFRTQLEFLRRHYRVLTLSEFVGCLSSPESFPERTALVTFDDGLANNHRVAFPVLKDLQVPATVFLTTDLIGTDRILWVDELMVLLVAASDEQIPLPWPDLDGAVTPTRAEIGDTYWRLVERLKRTGAVGREAYLSDLRDRIPVGVSRLRNDCSMLSWAQVDEMCRSGLVEVGVHTASHRILSLLENAEWDREILAPREQLSSRLGREVSSFAFPNGIPGTDYRREHVDYLKRCGYRVAFSTESCLFDPAMDDPYQIGRIATGDDFTSHDAFFELSTSGFMRSVPRLGVNRQTRPNA